MKITVVWSTHVIETYSATIELPEDIAVQVTKQRAEDPDLTLSEALGAVEVDTDFRFMVEDLLPNAETSSIEVVVTGRDVAEITEAEAEAEAEAEEADS